MELENPTSLSTIKASHYFGRLREFGQLCMFVFVCDNHHLQTGAIYSMWCEHSRNVMRWYGGDIVVVWVASQNGHKLKRPKVKTAPLSVKTAPNDIEIG